MSPPIVAKAAWDRSIERGDTKLGLDVALKVLPHAFTQDPDRLARIMARLTPPMGLGVARRRSWFRGLVFCGFVVWGSVASTPVIAGQQSQTSDTAATSSPMTPPGYTGPPIPVLPEVVTRGESGVTIRAVRIDEPPQIDGSLTRPSMARFDRSQGLYRSSPKTGPQHHSRPRSGSCSTTPTCTCLRGSGKVILTGWSPTRCDMIQTGSQGARLLPSSSTRSTTRRKRVRFWRQPDWWPLRSPTQQRKPVQRRLERHLGVDAWPVRRRLDCRDGDPVQDPPVSTR